MTMEVQRFEKFASMAAAAIRNARVFRREQQQSRRLDVLLEMSGLITGHRSEAGPHRRRPGAGHRAGRHLDGAVRGQRHERGPRLLARRTTQTAASTDGEGDGDEARSLAGLEGTLASREPCAVSVTDAHIDAALQAEMVRLGEQLAWVCPCCAAVKWSVSWRWAGATASRSCRPSSCSTPVRRPSCWGSPSRTHAWRPRGTDLRPAAWRPERPARRSTAPLSPSRRRG